MHALKAGLLLALLTSFGAPAQAQQSSIVGSWHGTSICVDKAKHPACHDEEVIYDVTAVGGDTVTLRADKVVNGVREFMNESQFVRGSDGSWVAELPQYDIRVIIEVEGNDMKGRVIILPDQSLGRLMSLRRVGTE